MKYNINFSQTASCFLVMSLLLNAPLCAVHEEDPNLCPQTQIPIGYQAEPRLPGRSERDPLLTEGVQITEKKIRAEGELKNDEVKRVMEKLHVSNAFAVVILMALLFLQAPALGNGVASFGLSKELMSCSDVPKASSVWVDGWHTMKYECSSHPSILGACEYECGTTTNWFAVATFVATAIGASAAWFTHVKAASEFRKKCSNL